MYTNKEWKKAKKNEFLAEYVNIFYNQQSIYHLMELFALLAHDFLSENNFSEPELYEIIQILANSNFSYFSNLSKWFETYDMYIKTTDEYQNLKLLL